MKTFFIANIFEIETYQSTSNVILELLSLNTLTTKRLIYIVVIYISVKHDNFIFDKGT